MQRHGGPEDNFLPHTVHITELGREHPITAGIEDFDLVTEQYWVLHDDLIDVLATTTHPTQAWHPWHRPVTSPAIWTRLWGAGRIVVTTPGHSLDVLEQPGREYRHREGDGVGDPHRVGDSRSRGHLPRVPGHDRPPSAGAASSRWPTSTLPGAAAVAAEIPGAEAIDVETLLARPDVQTVLNLTIPAAHADISLGAIAAGKNMYVEKPLAVSLETAARSSNAPRRPASASGCAPDTVLGTGTQTARAAIDGGLIGRPMSASAVMVTPGHERWHPHPTSTTRRAAARCSTWGRTTSRHSSTCSGRCVAVVGPPAGCAPSASSARAPGTGRRIPVEHGHPRQRDSRARLGRALDDHDELRRGARRGRTRSRCTGRPDRSSFPTRTSSAVRFLCSVSGARTGSRCRRRLGSRMALAGSASSTSSIRLRSRVHPGTSRSTSSRS